MLDLPSRRRFIATVAGTSAAIAAASVFSCNESRAQEVEAARHNRTVLRSVKWGMIQTGGSVLEKFQLCKELGYDGMELISPTEISPKEIRAASEATGMPVHGLVNTKHWQVRLSSHDPQIRASGRQILDQAITNAKAFGGDSVLLVPGQVGGEDETHDHVWNRSIAEIRKSIPMAARLGVRILIENVWNGFCETPDQLKDYVDEISSPWVGVYFDIGNAQKFAPSEQWIKTLGARIVKLDIKDWGKKNGFCKIGDGDVDWKAVNEALVGTGFSGWSTAEVKGGDRDRLVDIAERMERVLE
jgi:hexulose-6-phosphate isomerase